MTTTPADWASKFEAAHGFVPSFNPAEVDAPWCGECCDFHNADDEHSKLSGETDMNQFTGTTDTDLEARCADLYQQIMAGFDSLPLATWTPEYRVAIRAIQGQEIEFRAICTELARRLAERTADWDDTMDAVLANVRSYTYACPCGGKLVWNDDATEATCQTCAVMYDGIKSLKVVPSE